MRCVFITREGTRHQNTTKGGDTSSEFSFFAEFDVAHADDGLLALFGLGCEDDGVLLLPSTDDQSFTREDMCSEADIDLFDHVGVVLEEVLLYRSGCDAHKTETMKDWSLKSSHSCHFGVNM